MAIGKSPASLPRARSGGKIEISAGTKARVSHAWQDQGGSLHAQHNQENFRALDSGNEEKHVYEQAETV